MDKPKGLSVRDVNLPNIGEDLETARTYRANREKAYKEGYEEFVNRAVPVVLNGKKYRAHPNINLYYDVTKACNCDCSFCIAKVTFVRNHRADLIKCWQHLEKALDICSPCAPSLQIVGGEPTLFSGVLRDLIAVINRRKPKRPVLGTNGYGLKGKLLEVIKHSRFEHINISRHHYNDDTNKRIMSGGVDSDHLAHACKELQGKVRLQCNMLDDEIDTYGEVMQFIAYAYHRLNVRNVAFAQLTPLPRGSFYEDKIIDDVESKLVDVDSILARIEQDNRFTFEKYRGGVACYYEIWKFTAYEEPMTITFKYSDNEWLEKADADPELLPDIVLHTDGTLSGSWCKDRKIIKKL